jgi:hypothetical protein
MVILIAADLSARVVDPMDFRRFKVQFETGCRPATGPLNAAVVLEDSTTAWVHGQWLLDYSEKTDNAWRDGLESMIKAARRFGWIKDDPLMIKAHVEWLG